MKQKTLFDSELEYDIEVKKHARTTDPATSHAAAASLPLSRLQRLALDAVRRHPNHTARELSQLEGWDVWKRMKELFDAGKIASPGVRKCRITNRAARVWILTDPPKN